MPPRASKTPPRTSKTPPGAPKTPPRASKMLPRPPRGTPTGFIFLWFFKSFAFLGLLGAILAQHDLLAAPKSLHDTSKRSQDASKTLSRTSRTRPRASKLPPRASKSQPEWPPADASCRRLLQTPWPSTKGGLAVVRPRPTSSIRQTTLVRQWRVQDGVETCLRRSPSRISFLKEG